MLGENAAIVVLFLVKRRIDGETLCGMRHLLIADSFGGNLLQGVNPTVTHTIAELLFLSPGNFGRQHICKGFTHNLLFHRSAWTHLGLRIGTHGDIEELLVEERHTPLNTPSTQALVGTKAVVEIKLS